MCVYVCQSLSGYYNDEQHQKVKGNSCTDNIMVSISHLDGWIKGVYTHEHYSKIIVNIIATFFSSPIIDRYAPTIMNLCFRPPV